MFVTFLYGYLKRPRSCLQVFCSVLLTNLGVQSKDPTVHGMAIDHLGAVAAQLKADEICDKKRSCWLLLEESGSCEICDESVIGSRPIKCSGCPRLFHAECVKGSQQEGDWLCHLCQCKQQLLDMGLDLSDLQTQDPAEEQVVLVQQALLNFLAQAAAVDSSIEYARE